VDIIGRLKTIKDGLYSTGAKVVSSNETTYKLDVSSLTVNAGIALIVIGDCIARNGSITLGDGATLTVYGNCYIHKGSLVGTTGAFLIYGDLFVGNGNVTTTTAFNGIYGNIRATGITVSGTGGITVIGDIKGNVTISSTGLVSGTAFTGNLINDNGGTFTAYGNSVFYSFSNNNAASTANLFGGTVTYFSYVNTGTVATRNLMVKQLFSIDYWSIPQLSVAIPAGAASQALPNVVVASLPLYSTVVMAKTMIKFRSLSNAGAANKLNGAQHIQIQKGGAGGYADAISLIDDQLTVAAAAVDAPGDVIMGDHDVVAKVSASDTYNFQWTDANADVANLTLNDVQVGIRIWYRV
jgi:hypothetical protein